jgi:CHAD domain-containing protein
LLQVATWLERCCLAPTLEGVHELRLAIRRCEPYGGVLRHTGRDPDRMAGEKRLLDKVMALTGPLRDAQLRHQRLLEGRGRTGPLRKALLAASEREVRKLERRVQRGLCELASDLARLLKAPAKAPRSARKALDHALSHRRERLMARIARLEEGDLRSLHKARIAVKRYRYLLEAFAAHLGNHELTALHGCERFQRRLGRWHDERIHLAWVERWIRSCPPALEREASSLLDAGRTRCADMEHKLVRALRRWRP